MPEEQTIAKLRSPRCRDGFDLHLSPVGGPDETQSAGWGWRLPAAVMTPRFRRLSLAAADPRPAPRIDHRYRSGAQGEDRAVPVDGVRRARRPAAQPPLRGLLGPELPPTAGNEGNRGLVALLDATVAHDDHPVGTGKMGPAGDPGAADARSREYELANADIADCSIMSTVPRANTNLPAVAIGERIGGRLLESSPPASIGSEELP